ncbi:MAG: microtubule-binding protein [Bdellovibrionia bacterium]
MDFGHSRKKRHVSHDSMWTSYADLFLGLSVIFLLLYVTASIRQGTDGVQQFIENRQLAKNNQDLKQQLKVYEALKQNYLETAAQQGEKDTYEVLMQKLTLLQEDAKDEKDKLREQANENEKKEQALNQYQQIVRNIINANMLAKARIKNRDTLITKKEDVIEGQSQEITDLESQVTQKKNEIDQNERRIESLEGTMEQKMAELKQAYKSKEISEKRFKEKQEKIQQEAGAQIAALRKQTQEAEQEMGSLTKELQATSAKLADTSEELGKTAEQLGEKSKQLAHAGQQAAVLKENLDATRGELGKTAGELSKTKGELNTTKDALGTTKQELAKAQENLNARKKLANAIKGKFAAGGVKADVDGKTGDVLLQFDGEYFDTGDSKLKPGMKKVLERAMPAYAQSLFEDPKISEKIENVEVVGFASPTYKGKYIDPGKLGAKEREAVNYNLDLSYKRARSIFDHVYSQMTFTHKQRLLPLVKVTGKSFLGDKNDRSVANDDEAGGACKKVDCAKKQTVIIRFKLKD